MADREAFEAWLCTLPAGAQQNIRHAHARGESLTAAAWQAAVAQTARECAEIVKSTPAYTWVDGSDQFGRPCPAKVLTTPAQYAQAIRERFGIKE